MARGRSIIVGGGIGAVGALALGAILEVVNTDPASVSVASASGVPVATYSRQSHLVIGTASQVLGTARFTTGGAAAGLVLIGDNAEITAVGGTNSSAVVLGNGAIARGTTGAVNGCVVIGQGATAISTSVLGATVIGGGAAYTGGSGGVVIGNLASSSAQNATVIGTSAIATASNTVAIGDSTIANSQRVTVVGSGATWQTGTDSVGIGQGVAGTGSRSVAIAASPGAFNDSVSILCTQFANNTFMVGGNGGNAITTVLFGKGNASASPTGLTFRLTNATGTDIAGGDVALQAGLGTGAGLPGAVNLVVGIQTGTSGTLQVARTGVACVFSSVAADTYLMVYDVNGAGLKRVSVGANDSGGAGFKLLRITN
jgi:hypothetical protein